MAAPHTKRTTLWHGYHRCGLTVCCQSGALAGHGVIQHAQVR